MTWQPVIAQRRRRPSATLVDDHRSARDGRTIGRRSRQRPTDLTHETDHWAAVSITTIWTRRDADRSRHCDLGVLPLVIGVSALVCIFYGFSEFLAVPPSLSKYNSEHQCRALVFVFPAMVLVLSSGTCVPNRCRGLHTGRPRAPAVVVKGSFLQSVCSVAVIQHSKCAS